MDLNIVRSDKVSMSCHGRGSAGSYKRTLIYSEKVVKKNEHFYRMKK